MKTVYMLCTLGSLAGFVVGAGCWGVAEGHCGNIAGDQTCAERGDGAYCDTCRLQSNGCTDVRPSADCHFAGTGTDSTTIGGSETTVSVDATDTTVLADTTYATTEAGSSAEGTTIALSGEPGTTTGGPECVNDTECASPTPFCGTQGECVASCDDTADPDVACANLEMTTPLCFLGQCVSCEDRLLIFEPTAGVCVPCTDHDQCTSRACDIFVGTCFDPDRVFEVGSPGGPGNIDDAVMDLASLGADRLGERRGVLVLHNINLMTGGAEFDEAVTIDAVTYDAVAFIAAPREINVPIWTYTNDDGGMASPTLTVTGATTRTYLDQVQLWNDTNSTDGQSLHCHDARVDVRRSRIVENLGGGIVASGECELVVQNTFIGVNPNQGDADNRDALLITEDTVMATILYSTLGAGQGGAALRCPDLASVDIRNSFLVSLSSDEEVECPSAAPMTNATEAGLMDNMNANWFNNYDAGDFHLTNNAPDGIIIADWLPGDPTTDIDGTPRITAEGQFGRAGADVP